MSEFVTVANVDDIPLGHAKVVHVGTKRLAIAHCEDGFFAIDDMCTHDGGPLGEGKLHGCAVECPRHGAQFDVRSGQAIKFPAVMPVNTYEVRVVGDEVQVKVP
nr:non-heme iron oxygenase ferredoxin subunit [Ardenticatena sp.]